MASELDAYCEEHDFWWDISDEMGCPVCHGYAIGYLDGFSDGCDYIEGIE